MNVGFHLAFISTTPVTNLFLHSNSIILLFYYYNSILLYEIYVFVKTNVGINDYDFRKGRRQDSSQQCLPFKA